MIEYKIDAKSALAADSQLKDMRGVLQEIAVSYALVLDTLEQHRQSISSPSIDAYRQDLRRQLNNAILSAKNIVDSTQKLAIVCEEATKHLTAFEEHYSAALQKQLQPAGRE